MDFFFWSTTYLQPEKKVDLWYKTTFFSGQPLFSNQISRTIFHKPIFYTFLEKWLQIKWSTTAVSLWIINCGYNKEIEIFAVLLLHIQIRSVKVCWAVIIWASKQFAQPTCLLPFTYLLPPALLPAIQYRYDLFLNLKSFFSLLLCTSHTKVLIYMSHGELISIIKIKVYCVF